MIALDMSVSGMAFWYFHCLRSQLQSGDEGLINAFRAGRIGDRFSEFSNDIGYLENSLPFIEKTLLLFM